MSRLVILALCVLFCCGCQKTMNTNPVVYFEIPVTDMSRATKFYSAVFGFDYEMTEIDGNQMALLRFDEGARGITGALVKGSTYEPATQGSLVYFHTEDIATVLQRAVGAGGKILYPRTSIGKNGFVAEIQDSEGNRVALSEPLK